MAINEDHNEKSLFQALENGPTNLCYASPECLLRNNHFKQLFRSETFRKRLVAVIVDEAHVMFDWAREFRKDYAELKQLRVLTGMETPWALFSATLPTEIFNFCFDTVGMGQHRPFWGIDLGSDRPNLALWVRPMEYSKSSFHALLPLVPDSPATPSDLPKSIFYFSTRREAREACNLLRRCLPATLRNALAVFTAVFSDAYKETTMEAFRLGITRWLFCTDAAGMGCDVPDILWSIIYGVQNLCSAIQKGGRAVRNQTLRGTMLWIVEDWTFEPRPDEENETANTSTRASAATKDAERREKLDPAARTFINRSQSSQCMREYAVEYFTPEPAFRTMVKDGGESWGAVWEGRDLGATSQGSEKLPAGACCSARSCRLDHDVPIGLLTSDDRKRIAKMQAMLDPNPSSVDLSDPEHPGITTSPSRRCSEAERDNLREMLHTWRDSYWRSIRAENPLLSWHWVLDEETIGLLVTKAHRVVNQKQEVTEALVRDLVTWVWDDRTMEGVVGVLEAFRVGFRARADAKRKKPRTVVGEEAPVSREQSPTHQPKPARGQAQSSIPGSMLYQ